MEEIEARHDGEWVVPTGVGDDPAPVFRRGRVSWHGADHDEAWERTVEIPPPITTAVLYVGDRITRTARSRSYERSLRSAPRPRRRVR